MEVGYVNCLILLNAETTCQQARILRVQAQTMRFGHTVALFQALGADGGIEKKLRQGEAEHVTPNLTVRTFTEWSAESQCGELAMQSIEAGVQPNIVIPPAYRRCPPRTRRW